MVNSAAELGPQRFSWWLDWRGKTVAVVACGPSAKGTGVELLKGRLPIIAIKQAGIDLVPWADVIYGCDAAWWRNVAVRHKLQCLKIAWAKDVCNGETGIVPIKLALFDGVQTTAKLDLVDRIMVDEPGFIGGGGNSGFQALNLAVQFGATRIMLIGYDMSDRGGSHYYGRNMWHGANNPSEPGFIRWKRAFEKNQQVLTDLGVEVINAAPLSALKCFPRMTVQQAIEKWNL